MYQEDKILESLRKRAEKIIDEPSSANKTYSYSEFQKIIRELELSRTELKIQQEDLENALLEIEAIRNRYNGLYDFIPFGVFTLNQSGNIVEANEAGASLLGIKQNSLINISLTRYIATDYHYIFSNHIQLALEKDELHSCEIKIMRRDGPLFYAQMNSKSLTNRVSGKKFLLTFLTDITERKQRALALQNQQNKMSSFDRNLSVEKFASIVVHELNHPLAITANCLYGSINRLESGNYDINEIIKALKIATEQSHRASDIILRLKNFTCKGSLQYELVQIDELINETINLIYHETMEYPVNIYYKPIKNLPNVVIDKVHIQQVILNLARNAIEAMRDACTEQPKLTIEINRFNMEFLEVSIIDNGPGISDDSVYKLFSPYFSTKLYGVGLGLAVSQSIVEAHGGQVHVEKTTLGSACFIFTLPLKQKQITYAR